MSEFLTHHRSGRLQRPEQAQSCGNAQGFKEHGVAVPPASPGPEVEDLEKLDDLTVSQWLSQIASPSEYIKGEKFPFWDCKSWTEKQMCEIIFILSIST